MVFIIATKDRPFELRRLLISIERQSFWPKQIIVVDAGTIRAENTIREFPRLPIIYLSSHIPSASSQRNEGLSVITKSAQYIGFIDDDAVFEENSFLEMNRFWSRAHPSVVGAGFNLINPPPLFATSFKTHSLIERLGLYSSKKGIVLRSGFQTMIGTVDRDTKVDWLPSGAVIWKKLIFRKYRFDEWYKGYSYLEDLDFSYAISRSHHLFVVARAKYQHLPTSQSRGDDYKFGLKESRHRLHFVHKNPELSRFKCCQSLFIRMIISFLMFIRTGSLVYLKRIIGNIIGFF